MDSLTAQYSNNNQSDQKLFHNFDEFKQIKKSGAQRRQKLEAIKNCGTQTANFQKDQEEKEEFQMYQQNIVKNNKLESKIDSVYQADNQQINFDMISQELQNNSRISNKPFSDRKQKQGQIVIDKELMEQAKPLFQKYSQIDLDISDPQQIPRFQVNILDILIYIINFQTLLKKLTEQSKNNKFKIQQEKIKQYKENQNSWIQQSESISSKVKQYSKNRNESQNFDTNNDLDMSQEDNNFQANPFQSPFEQYFTKQQEQLTQKQKHKFQEKMQNKQGERKEDEISYYQDHNEEQNNTEQKSRYDYLQKHYDFEKLNRNKKQLNRNQFQSGKIPIKPQFQRHEENRDSITEQNKSNNLKLEQQHMNNILYVTQQQEIPDYQKELKTETSYTLKDNVQGLLFPQMYKGKVFKFPSQLYNDPVETYLGGFQNYRSLSQKQQNEMIFNQVSPLAREAFQNLHQVETQYPNNYFSNHRIDNSISPKDEELNFDTIINIVGQNIPNDFGSQKNVVTQDNEIMQKEQITQRKKTASQEINNFKNILHSQSNNNNANNINYNSAQSKISNKDINQNESAQFDLPVQDKSNQKLLFDQGCQYDDSLFNDKNNEIIQEKKVIVQQHSPKMEEQQKPSLNQNFKIPQTGFQKMIQTEYILNNPQNEIPLNAEDVFKKQKIEQILYEIDQLQYKRINPNITKDEEERVIQYIQMKLHNLLDFVRYDNNHIDIFGEVTTQQFLQSFPQNVEKIKGQRVGGLSKILLLYKYFENFLPLVQQNQNLMMNDQKKNSPERLIIKQQNNHKIQHINGSNTMRNNTNQNKNKDTYQNSKSPIRNDQRNAITQRSKVQQKQSSKTPEKVKTYQSPAKHSQKNQRNAAIIPQLKSYKNVQSKIDTGLDKFHKDKSPMNKSPMNKSPNKQFHNQDFPSPSKISSISLKGTAGCTTNKSLSNIGSPNNRNLMKQNINQNNLSYNTYSMQPHQSNNYEDSTSNNRSSYDQISARTQPNQMRNFLQNMYPIQHNKVNKSEDFSNSYNYNNNNRINIQNQNAQKINFDYSESEYNMNYNNVHSYPEIEMNSISDQ